MCQFPSCCVTRDKKLLWNKDIHSHSEIMELAGIHNANQDNVAKYEYSLQHFELRIDFLPGRAANGPFKKSHDDIALRHFEKHYGSPELLIKAAKKLNPEKFTQWTTLYSLLNDNTDLPGCPYPCPSPHQRPYPYPCLCLCPCRYLSKRQHRDWARAWKKKWIELYSDPENRY